MDIWFELINMFYKYCFSPVLIWSFIRHCTLFEYKSILSVLQILNLMFNVNINLFYSILYVSLFYLFHSLMEQLPQTILIMMIMKLLKTSPWFKDI